MERFDKKMARAYRIANKVDRMKPTYLQAAKVARKKENKCLRKSNGQRSWLSKEGM